MNEKDLLGLWSTARLQVIVSQLAPVFLLTVTVGALGLHDAHHWPLAARLAGAGVLLASGILGAIAQYTAAGEAQAIAADLRRVENPSHVVQHIVRTIGWAPIVKYVTPAIFVLIYLAILSDLFLP